MVELCNAQIGKQKVHWEDPVHDSGLVASSKKQISQNLDTAFGCYPQRLKHTCPGEPLH
jgi:hypothetical protein